MKRLIFLSTLLSSIVLCASLTAFIRADDDAQAKDRKESKDKLLKMVLGMHNYHNDFNCLPAHAIYDSSGKTPLLSWRVSILPYLGHDDLFKKFRFEEPWDSATNKSLIKQMPSIFSMPGVKSEPGMTYYQVITMPVNTPAGKSAKYTPAFPLLKSKFTLGQITVQDGCSGTLAIAEAGEPVIWTKPQDLVLENDDAPLPKLGIRSDTDEFLVICLDGSVKQINKKIDDMKLHTRLMKQMIGRKDGHNEDLDKIVKP